MDCYIDKRKDMQGKKLKKKMFLLHQSFNYDYNKKYKSVRHRNQYKDIKYNIKLLYINLIL